MLERLTGMSTVARTRLRDEFAGADPFPHLVVDDVLDADPAVLLADFPAADWPRWHRFRDAYQAEKRTYADLDGIPGRLGDLVQEMQGPAFLRWLQDVTGVERLLSDPYLEGGGLHASGPGGVLAPHSDFHTHPTLPVFRRLNALLYLNPGWADDAGGALELYADPEATRCVRRVPPVWGRLVVFRTDVRSVHGFTDPVPGGAERRSVATYYYTVEETAAYAGDRTTIWRRHEESGPGERAQLAAYRGLLAGSRALSKAAHAVNPTVRRARLAERRDG